MAKETGHSLTFMISEGKLDREMLPYEKFKDLGPQALTDAELLAVIIRTGAGGITPMEIGRRILGRGGGNRQGLSSLYQMSVRDLEQIPGIGEVKAVQLKCIAELSNRIVRERTVRNLSFLSPRRIAEHYMEQLRHEESEQVLLLSLNSRMKLIAERVVFVGTVNRSPASPREIFLEALRHGAVNIIVLHNHPGGDPMPSGEDVRFTRALRASGEMIGIRLADHLIIGDKCYFSFKEQGYLEDDIPEGGSA
jgi:DNA repair protein RadC